jgi:hypothetical protein
MLTAILTASYCSGQILLPEQVASQPAVYVQGLNPGTIYNSTFPYFTLAIVDPDAPDPTAPTSSLILHLLKVNIPTNTPASSESSALGVYCLSLSQAACIQSL